MGPPARPSAYALTFRQGREPISRLSEDFTKRLREVDARPAAAGPRPEPPLPHITMARPRMWEESQTTSVGAVTMAMGYSLAVHSSSYR
jgi:hypothetical protein